MKLKKKVATLRTIKKIARAKSWMKKEKDKEVIDIDKFNENLNPPKHRHWKNKKQMKAYKKLRKQFLNS